MCKQHWRSVDVLLSHISRTRAWYAKRQKNPKSPGAVKTPAMALHQRPTMYEGILRRPITHSCLHPSPDSPIVRTQHIRIMHMEYELLPNRLNAAYLNHAYGIRTTPQQAECSIFESRIRNTNHSAEGSIYESRIGNTLQSAERNVFKSRIQNKTHLVVGNVIEERLRPISDTA